MFNWIKKLFSKPSEAKKDSSKEDNIYTDFTIEYYPAAKKYFPKFKDYYIDLNYTTGFYELQKPCFMQYCEYGRTKEEALKIIENYISLLPVSAKTMPVTEEDIKNVNTKVDIISEDRKRFIDNQVKNALRDYTKYAI